MSFMFNQEYTIFLFPFAGGSAQSFTSLTTSFEQHSFLRPIPVHYPGRGILFGERLCENIECLVDALYEEVKNSIVEPYVFWGHSMGGLLSYLLTRKLKKGGEKLPKHLFISACAGPSVSRNFSTEQLSSIQFWNFIKELGGCPKELLEEDELMDLFEPVLRADFKCIEQYTHKEEEKLNVPITLLLGNQDRISLSEAKLWQEETSLPVRIRYFEGGHFFLFNHVSEITDLIYQTSLS